ncbi:aminotransferase class V-fold PLP-dependent enzyme [Streptomyces boncukensis]|uniref:Aminotransferase class V-fold PLP-dependent enzyme n=1 Tax=Streptomyces boncukensis TaxID=2711219 RepID=A0A6G4X0J6_9ACTN|nr:aminotransferase class V-fold PLP-dependent enzyme [Streptomyces boncukensis]NGO70773.1 aminotransferase class V-fold PLP-dependent enzyme [Streptomyces boncukensis]
MSIPRVNTPAKTGVSRRTFAGVLGGGAATVGLGTLAAPSARAAAPAAPAAGGAASAALPAPSSKGYWDAVRRLFVLDKKVLFMNVGTVGSPPREVIETVDRVHREVAVGAESAYSDFADIRAVAARGFGCDPDELVISHNTTDGMAKIVAGLALREGDEILTTNHEHSGGNVPMALARDRHGVVIKRVALPVGNDQRAEDYVTLFKRAITSRTKVLLFSAPTYKTGTMLPIRMLAGLAQDHGLTTVVDGAHIPGMMAYDFHELGVDFLAGSAAKWQCGPGGTGILYVRNKVLPRHNPNPLPEFWPVVSSGYPAEGGRPARTDGPEESYDIAADLQKVGNGSLAVMAGVGSACEVWDRIGRRRIQRHVLGLSRHLKELVAERWGVKSLYSPKDDPRLVCALTSFAPFRDAGDVHDAKKTERLVSRLKDEYGIVIRTSDFPVIGSSRNHQTVRVSTHLFHQKKDVERVVEALWRLSGEMS